MCSFLNILRSFPVLSLSHIHIKFWLDDSIFFSLAWFDVCPPNGWIVCAPDTDRPVLLSSWGRCVHHPSSALRNGRQHMRLRSSILTLLLNLLFLTITYHANIHQVKDLLPYNGVTEELSPLSSRQLKYLRIKRPVLAVAIMLLASLNKRSNASKSTKLGG